MKRIWAAAALAAALGLALPASAQDHVKIGVLNDQTGLYAEFGGMGSVEATKMAIEDFGGKALGKPIEILAVDHQNKPDIAAATARKWYDADGVTAIADLTNSAVALAVQAIAKERGKIALFSGPATTRLTNEDCSPTGFHWVFDTYSQAYGTARAVLAEKGDTWFLLVANYAFGHQMAKDLETIVTTGGGKVLGNVRHPISNADFSSFLLQAQASKAKIVGLANAGADTITSVKQAAEFGIVEGGQKLVGLVIVLSDIHALGLNASKGLLTTTAFYHDRDDASRAWSKRYFARTQKMPGMIQAGVYSSVLHYLRAVEAAGTTDGAKVAAKMRETPVDDFFAPKAKIRADGRLANDMYLVEVKAPGESKAAWDYLKVLRTIPAAEVTIPLAESQCSLVKK
ncbi:amino acid/amide ABC transporter substrate-binding protein (HAAT family) [Stella humosa]|uniref:Amino acid/amide ABC transporter substrate-binding protein (HAAT family) n=1 Tax=Stella humosa TaxID=94 RepID=A0A3N1KXA5_9PROT|nr:ABC transporter substrate-binding protein [Stella humosa]ROP83857.1 amino acid/amide ABC transporter substrate-binding protein (HAAT family) [Stella humosa]BBK32881.1 ABC transporter permease [Stella humosa]